MEDFTQWLQLGVTGAIFVFFIYNYFKFEAGKKTPFNGSSKAILDELKKQNENELVHLQSGMDNGFRDLRSCHETNSNRVYQKLDMLIEVMGEIKGLLNR